MFKDNPGMPKPANRVLAALLSEHGRVVDGVAQRHVEATEAEYAEALAEDHERDLHRHDDDGGPGCPHDRRAAQEEARRIGKAPELAMPYGVGYSHLLGGDLVAHHTGEALPDVVSKSYHDLVAPGWVHDPESKIVVEGKSLLPTGYDERKSIPIATGLLDYFPKACAAVAVVSRIGNDQHNPGEPLHWARGKSMDQDNTAIRHFIERGGFDTDGARHTAKAAWRLLARLELEIEADGLGLERKPA